MKEFKVMMFLEAEDVDYYGKTSPKDIWDNMLDGDYVEMILEDLTVPTIITGGDTKHDDIYTEIRNFLWGVSYCEQIAINYVLHYPDETEILIERKEVL